MHFAFFCMISVSSSLILNIPLKVGLRYGSSLKMALKEGVREKILSLTADYESLTASIESERNLEKKAELFEKRRPIKAVIDSMTALTTIEKDLLTFEDHLAGDDMKLKETAEVYIKEFTQCQVEIETQLNKLFE